MDRSNLGRIERGNVKPSLDTVLAIAGETEDVAAEVAAV
jgi:transcriptional regulator with XRE-family HTH domain